MSVSGDRISVRLPALNTTVIERATSEAWCDPQKADRSEPQPMTAGTVTVDTQSHGALV